MRINGITPRNEEDEHRGRTGVALSAMPRSMWRRISGQQEANRSKIAPTFFGVGR
jgi:hypothetical protein